MGDLTSAVPTAAAGSRDELQALLARLGGMQAQAWALLYPERVRHCLVIASALLFDQGRLTRAELVLSVRDRWTPPAVAAFLEDLSAVAAEIRQRESVS